MKKYKKITLICSLLLVILFCCSCGRETIPPTAPTSQSTTAATNAAPEIPAVTASPIEQGSANGVLNFVMTDTPLVVEEYLPIKLTDAPDNYSSLDLHTAAYGNQLYMLADYLYESGNHAFRFHIFEMDTKELTQREFFMDNADWKSFYVLSMNVLDKDTLSFRLSCLAKDSDKYSTILYQTDLNGKCLNMQTPFPTEESYPWNAEFGSLRTFTIPDINTYVTSWNNSDSATTISTYDKDTKRYTTIANIPNDFILTLTAASLNDLYYIGNGYITLYHPEDKTGIRLCSLTDCGISLLGDSYLLVNKEKKLAVVSQSAENPGIYFLTPKQQNSTNTENTIRLTRLVPYGMEYVSKRAAVLTNTSDSIQIEVEKLSDSLYDDTQAQEAFHDRIMMEITSGGGPELLWVSRKDMELLASKGALMDLETLLPEDIKEQLLPGLLDLRVNGTLVGTSPEISFHTMLASDKWWQEDSWTTTDFLDIAETKTDWSEPILYSKAGNMNYYFLLYGVLLQHYDDFINFDQKTCNFQQENFLRMLKFCKEYGAPNNAERQWEDLDQMLKDGESFARVIYFYDGFPEFSRAMTQRSSYSHIVGYPTSQGSESYIYSEGYLVVNANATHIEEIKEFLKCLFSYENQYTVNWTPVRKDVLRDCITKSPYSGEYEIRKDVNSNLVMKISTKPDGSTWIEEFMDFAESAVPEPSNPQAIGDILASDLPSYFEGTKSGEETINIIQNRVQLYLDESK